MDILSAAKRYDMLHPGDLVLVAVSGGPDSVAMLHALRTRSEEFGITLHVAHLNHGIRGSESNLDEELVRNLAQEHGLKCTIARIDIPALMSQIGIGEEEAARETRYKFLQETATKTNASKIAVGHTADDRAESVLLNVIRGTGIDGLGSIRPVRENIVRPLIDTHRSEIEAYIREHGLEYRVDKSNLDTTYARNRVRHELLPLLERSYNPQVKAALVRLAEIAAAHADLLPLLADSAIHQIARGDAFDADLFLRLPLALQYEVIRSEIEKLKGDLRDVSFEQIERVVKSIAEGRDFTTTLPSGRIYASRRASRLSIWAREEPRQVERFDRELPIPGSLFIPEIGLSVECDLVDMSELHDTKTPPDEALIDADSLKGPLRVRNHRPGDRIQPLGMRGSRKLQDIFVDKKIPRRERARVAVITDEEKIVWVVGVVVAELVRVTDRTRRVIHLSLAWDAAGRRIPSPNAQ